MNGDFLKTRNTMQIILVIDRNNIKRESQSFNNTMADFLLDTWSYVNIIRLSYLKYNVKLVPGKNIYF